MPKKKSRKLRAIIEGHLERISSKAFNDYSNPITELISKRHGVYALYKNDSLYYVGLATDLKRRLEQHLNDRHKKKWDRFALYLIRKAGHLREMESLIVRNAKPAGNRTKGKFPSAENLRKKFNRLATEQDRKRRGVILGTSRKEKLEKRDDKIHTRATSHAKSYRPIAGSYQAELLKCFRSGKPKRIEAIAQKFNKRPGSIRGKLNGFARYGTISVDYSSDKSKASVHFLVPVEWSGKRSTRIRRKDQSSPLKGKLRSNQKIRVVYKGKPYNATVRKSGKIYYKGKLYHSPTAAALAIVDSGTRNGLTFWKYRNKSGDWVPLKTLFR